MKNTRSALGLLALLLLSLLASACGNKGELVRPEAAAEASAES